MDIRESIVAALAIERDGLDRVIARAGDSAVEAVRRLAACRGRVIITGMGKAGLIGRKIAATLASTGTPSHFMHPTEAVHGDLGMVTPSDVVIAISNSGETREITDILPYLRAREVGIIALTGKMDSTLARNSDLVVDVGVDREACPLGMAPTASSTAALAMGDALAAALMRLKGFTKQQYAQFHPGGSIGASLLSRVRDLMVAGDSMPAVSPDVTVRDVLFEITSKRLGVAFVVDNEGRLLGCLTDGDLRRVFQREPNPLDTPVSRVMTCNPKHIAPDALAVEAMRLMEDHAITTLAVTEQDNVLTGVVHLHDLVKAGLSLWTSVDE